MCAFNPESQTRIWEPQKLHLSHRMINAIICTRILLVPNAAYLFGCTKCQPWMGSTDSKAVMIDRKEGGTSWICAITLRKSLELESSLLRRLLNLHTAQREVRFPPSGWQTPKKTSFQNECEAPAAEIYSPIRVQIVELVKHRQIGSLQGSVIFIGF